MKTVEQLENEYNREVKNHGGHWEVCEFDAPWVNAYSRAKVRAYKRKWGNAWLGKINLYGEERAKQTSFYQYKKGMIYNFQFDFVIPEDDEKLAKLIWERNQTFTTTKEDARLIDEIFDRITELKGIFLRWE